MVFYKEKQQIVWIFFGLIVNLRHWIALDSELGYLVASLTIKLIVEALTPQKRVGSAGSTPYGIKDDMVLVFLASV